MDNTNSRIVLNFILRVEQLNKSSHVLNEIRTLANAKQPTRLWLEAEGLIHE